MKVPCKVIEDLLPLYVEKACSKESCLLIEEHLKECQNCRQTVTNMQKQLVSEETLQINLNEAKVVKNLSKKWRRKKLQSFLKGAVIATVVIGILIFILLFIVGFDVTPPNQ